MHKACILVEQQNCLKGKPRDRVSNCFFRKIEPFIANTYNWTPPTLGLWMNVIAHDITAILVRDDDR